MIPHVFMCLALLTNFLTVQDTNAPQEIDSLIKSIEKLEEFIKENPANENLALKRSELALFCFKTGMLSREKRPQHSKTYFLKSSATYEALAHSFRRESCELKKAKDFKKAKIRAEWSSDHYLKTALCYYQLMQHKNIKNSQKQKYLSRADLTLNEVMGTTPVNSPVMMWIWLYKYLIATEKGNDFEAKAYLTALAGPQNGIVDVKKSLSGKSKTPWLVSTPIDFLFLKQCKRLMAGMEYDKVIEIGKDFINAYKSSKSGISPIGDHLLMEIYRAYSKKEKLKDAGKVLVDVALRNKETALAVKALPLLKEWVDRCEPKGAKRYKMLPEAYYALGNGYLAQEKYKEALNCYDRYLGFKQSKKLLKKHLAHLTRSRGYCCYFMNNCAEAASLFKQSLDLDEENKKPLNNNCMRFWCAALKKAADQSKSRADIDKADAAKRKMVSLGMAPGEAPESLMLDISVNEVSVPPLSIFDAPLLQESLYSPSVEYLDRRESLVVKKEDKRANKMIIAGLDWLARHQSLSGCWSGQNFNRMCIGERCEGKGSPTLDTGATGLAVLAFLNAGESMIDSPHQEAVQHGLAYLCNVQNVKDGCLVAKSAYYYMYCHGVSCLAIVQGYRDTKWPSLAGPAKMGLNYIHDTKRPYMAWRYNSGENEIEQQNDVSVTGWMIRCLTTARDAGLPIDDNDLKEAMDYIESMTLLSTGRTGYQRAGTYSSREANDCQKWPYERTEAMTAVALYLRYLTIPFFEPGRYLDKTLLKRGSGLLGDLKPQWNESDGFIDMYYWYYGSLAMSRRGGSDLKQWKGAALKAYAEGQSVKGCENGSWDPTQCPWGDTGGRVYSTAVCVMALEALCLESKNKKR